MAGKNYGVYRRRPDSLRHVISRKPITITAPAIVAKSLALRQFRFVGLKPKHRPFRRMQLPITITAPPVSSVLNLSVFSRLNQIAFKRKHDFLKRAKLPITITAPVAPSVSQVLQKKLTFVNRIRKRDELARRRINRIVLPTPAIEVSPILKQSAMVTMFRSVFKRRSDFLRHVRRIKLITITRVIRTAVLKSPGDVFKNRAVFRREFDYYLRFTIRRKPITITTTPTPDTLENIIRFNLFIDQKKDFNLFIDKKKTFELEF